MQLFMSVLFIFLFFILPLYGLYWAIKKILRNSKSKKSIDSFVPNVRSNAETTNKAEEIKKAVDEPFQLPISLADIKYDVTINREFNKYDTNKIHEIRKGEIVLNKGDNVELVLSNCSKNIAVEIVNLLNDSSTYYENKDKIIELFLSKNILFKNVVDYIKENQPKYFLRLDELLKSNLELENLSELDKKDLIEELKEDALDILPYFISHNTKALLSFDLQSDLTIDDSLLNSYNYNLLVSYFNLRRYGKIYSVPPDSYLRTKITALAENGLALRGKEIPINKILEFMTLKNLNEVAMKYQKKFTRKTPAIEYLMQQNNIIEELSQMISFRELFYINDDALKISEDELQKIQDLWSFTIVMVELLIDSISNLRWNRTDNTSNEFILGHNCEECPLCKSTLAMNNKTIKLPLHLNCDCYY